MEAEVITTDGVEAITTGGPTIVVGEASLANDDDSRGSRQSGGFAFCDSSHRGHRLAGRQASTWLNWPVSD